MFTYFVRYSYSSYERKSNERFNDDYYVTELVENVDSEIIITEFEITDIDQVRNKLKEVTHINEYFDIIAINRL